MAPERGPHPGGVEGEGRAVPPSPIRAGGLRHGLTNVLIIGGTAAQREGVARTFHRESPLHAGPFVKVDCLADQDTLRAALQAWRISGGGSHTNPLSEAEAGTLFLEQVEDVSPDTQPLLLALAHRLRGEQVGTPDRPCAGRLITGNPRGLSVVVGEGRFDRALSDALDKVRVDLGPPGGATGSG